MRRSPGRGCRCRWLASHRGHNEPGSGRPRTPGHWEQGLVQEFELLLWPQTDQQANRHEEKTFPFSGLVASPGPTAAGLARATITQQHGQGGSDPRNALLTALEAGRRGIIRVPARSGSCPGPPSGYVLPWLRKPGLVSLPVFIRRPHSPNLNRTLVTSQRLPTPNFTTLGGG